MARMKLYHGTTEVAARSALTRGLLPRAVSKTSNWRRTVQSNAKAVYLTNVYAVYFAVQAANELRAVNKRLAIIEVDTDCLDQAKLVPDEDVLERAMRGKDGLPGSWTIYKRVRYYRSRIKHYAGKFVSSLDTMGTCAYLGVIKPEAFCRIAYIDYKAATVPIWLGADAAVSPQNYKLVGAQHRAVTNWIFNEPFGKLSPLEAMINGDAIAKLRAFQYIGVEIEQIASARS
jgi:hypothetical protein